MSNSKTQNTVGIDEAGRGALAGPLTVASVFLSQDQERKIQKSNLPLRDSKTLSESQRERVFGAFCDLGIVFEVRIIAVSVINKNGIGWANAFGIRELVKHFQGQALETAAPVIVDGYFPPKKIAVPGACVRCQVDADATVLPVILAGIVAKVTRDRIMKALHRTFPRYLWERNKGYGTAAHVEAISTYGICREHRTRFVETALKKSNFLSSAGSSGR